MGYMRHHAIVVTSWNEEKIKEARTEIIDVGRDGWGDAVAEMVSPLTQGLINGQWSFLVAPDGSKEGWSHSDMGDAFREEAIRVLMSYAYDDGSTSIEWCEVQFGDDNRDNRMRRNDAAPHLPADV